MGEGVDTTLMVLLDRLSSLTVEFQELRLAFHQKFGPYTPSAHVGQVEEKFTEGERRRLLSLAIEAVPKDHGDPELTALIAKISGTDTTLIARRVRFSVPGKHS